MTRIAITRGISANINRCELTHLDRQAISIDLARQQHREYEQCLAQLGCEVLCLPGEADLPDCVFVEDIAIVLDEVAILTRPGAASRRAERPVIAEALQAYRDIVRISAPGTLDGGDVLVVGKQVFIGLSSRSNDAGINQARQAMAEFGYSVTAVQVKGCLHLKSAVCQVAQNTLLINQDWIDGSQFTGFEFIDVDPTEPGAACVLLIDKTVLCPAEYTRTRDRLSSASISTLTFPLSELAKAEAGSTCCSLIFNANDR